MNKIPFEDGTKTQEAYVTINEQNYPVTPAEVIDKNEQAVSLYGAIGILWKGFQEQQAKVEKLEERLEQEVHK